MTVPTPNAFSHATYRIFLKRRLILLCLIVVIAGAMASRLTLPGISLFHDPTNLGILVGVWLVVLIGNSIIYPAGWIDALCASLAMAIMLLATPYLQIWSDGSGKGGALLEPYLFWPLVVLTGYLIFAICVLAMSLLDKIPVGEQTLVARGYFDQPPEVTRRALTPSPGVSNRLRNCGPTNDEGWFSIRSTHLAPDPKTFRLTETVLEYEGRVLTQDAQGGKMEYRLDNGGRVSTSVVKESFTPKGTGTLYTMTDRHDHFSILAWMGYWLEDFGADHARATLDAHLNRPSLAIYGTPRRTMLTSLARMFTWNRAET